MFFKMFNLSVGLCQNPLRIYTNELSTAASGPVLEVRASSLQGHTSGLNLLNR